MHFWFQLLVKSWCLYCIWPKLFGTIWAKTIPGHFGLGGPQSLPPQHFETHSLGPSLWGPFLGPFGCKLLLGSFIGDGPKFLKANNYATLNQIESKLRIYSSCWLIVGTCGPQYYLLYCVRSSRLQTL